MVVSVIDAHHVQAAVVQHYSRIKVEGDRNVCRIVLQMTRGLDVFRTAEEALRDMMDKSAEVVAAYVEATMVTPVSDD